jgi:hypothetical protein
MRQVPRVGFALVLASSLAAGQDGAARTNLDTFLTTDRFVAHDSTVPINAGKRVGLFVCEKLAQDTARQIANGSVLNGRVVPFIRGVSVPSAPIFDLEYGDYSWMRYLAAAGFDTFAMDQTGYGRLPRAALDNPCNLDESDRRLSLVDWSLGGLRAGGYAARCPDKVDKLVLYAPYHVPGSLSDPPAAFPPVGEPNGLLHEASRQWVSEVRYRGRSPGEYRVDCGGLEPE